MKKGRAIVDRRAAMPIVAAWIDECRATFGRVGVDRAMAAGVVARREFDRVCAERGPDAARRWHRANAHRCTFAATEAGQSVGLPSPYGQPPTPTDLSDPPIGTPSATSHAGVSTPDFPPVANLAGRLTGS